VKEEEVIFFVDALKVCGRSSSFALPRLVLLGSHVSWAQGLGRNVRQEPGLGDGVGASVTRVRYWYRMMIERESKLGGGRSHHIGR